MFEKTERASPPHEFRPIIVLGLPYRTWSTIRARQCLKWFAQFAPEGLRGNLPGRSTTGLWWKLAMEAEAATQDQRKVSGFVTDVTKAYNNLPRPIAFACALHFGLPITFVRAWHAALGQVHRHFVV